MNVGDYVRTTYGIGKIENAYVVYSDDGAIWHLCYTTDNPKIEIGIYTEKNSWELFGEVQKDHSIKYETLNVNTQKYFDMVYKEKLQKPVCYVPVKNGIPRNASLYDDHKFIKSSPNIIDLIETGDYVNGQEVRYIDKDNGYCYLAIDEDYTYLIAGYDEDGLTIPIKSIVTKEQFKSMEYKVKE